MNLDYENLETASDDSLSQKLDQYHSILELINSLITNLGYDLDNYWLNKKLKYQDGIRKIESELEQRFLLS